MAEFENSFLNKSWFSIFVFCLGVIMSLLFKITSQVFYMMHQISFFLFYGLYFLLVLVGFLQLRNKIQRKDLVSFCLVFLLFFVHTYIQRVIPWQVRAATSDEMNARQSQ